MVGALCDAHSKRTHVSRESVRGLIARCEQLESQYNQMVNSLLGIDASRPGLSVAEAAKRAGISKHRLYAIIDRKGITGALTIEGRIRIPEGAIRSIKDGVTWPWNYKNNRDVMDE